MPSLVIPRTARALIAAKVEVTSGVDVFAGTYAAADIINVDPETIRFSPDPNETENRATSGRFGRIPSTLGVTTGRLDCSMPIRGFGAAYSAANLPEVHRLFRACMLAHTVITTAGLESVTYKPAATEETYTVYYVLEIPGGNAHIVKMVGCIATVRLRAVAGEGLFADFTIFGTYTRADHAYVAGSIPATPAYPLFKGAAFQIGSTNYAPCLGDMGMDLGVSIRYQRCANAVSGVAGGYVADRRPRLTFTPVGARTADFDWWTRLSSGAPMDDCSFQVGGTQYNRIKANLGATLGSQLQTITQSINGRDGIIIFPTELQPTISAGEDDFAWIFD